VMPLLSRAATSGVGTPSAPNVVSDKSGAFRGISPAHEKESDQPGELAKVAMATSVRRRKYLRAF
jgi:hypothetical protein